MANQPGYYYHLSNYALPAVYSQLDIHLSSQATERFFDTKSVHLRLIEGGDIHEITIQHPWHGASSLQVCAGRVRLHSQDDEVVQGFSLGGTLELVQHDTHSSCYLRSPAPIFNLSNDPFSPQGILVTELIALMAKKRAAWHDDERVRKMLAQVEPDILFAVMLKMVEDKLDAAPANLRTQKYRELRHAVQHTHQAIQAAGAWPSVVPEFDDLLPA